jgi:hypothetical protein
MAQHGGAVLSRPDRQEFAARRLPQHQKNSKAPSGLTSLRTMPILSLSSERRRLPTFSSVILVCKSPAAAPVKQLGKPRRGKDRQNLLANYPHLFERYSTNPPILLFVMNEQALILKRDASGWWTKSNGKSIW